MAPAPSAAVSSPVSNVVLSISTPRPASLTDGNDALHGISVGAYIGIAITPIIAMLLAVAGCYCYFRRWRPSQKSFDHVPREWGPASSMQDRRRGSLTWNVVPTLSFPSISTTILPESALRVISTTQEGISTPTAARKPASGFSHPSQQLEAKSSQEVHPTSSEEEDESPSSTSGSTSVSSGVTTAFEQHKRRAVDSIMSEFKSLLNHHPFIGISIRAGGGSPANQPSLTQPNEAPRRTSRDTSSPGKRSREEHRQGSGVEDGSDSKESKKAKREEDSNGPRFACPFYRRNPRKHSTHRACAGPGWISTHRVKEHIYRCHMLPIHCPRCGETFTTTGELTTHQRQPEGCSVQLVDLPEGIDKEQEALLRKKKKHDKEEDRWLDMYKTLFPDEDGDLIPSPYYENYEEAKRQREDELAQYERFQRRELIRVVRKLLEETVTDMARPLEDQLRAQFFQIVRQAQSEVYLSYRANNPNTKSPLIDPTPTGLESKEAGPGPVISSSSTAHDIPVLELSPMMLIDNVTPNQLDTFDQGLDFISRGDLEQEEILSEIPSGPIYGGESSRISDFQTEASPPTTVEPDISQIGFYCDPSRGSMSNNIRSLDNESDVEWWLQTSKPN